MKLAGGEQAKVPEAKIVSYLLNREHRSGKSKARFFGGHGFNKERWKDLVDALRHHACDNEVTKEETTPLGVRFVIEGPMRLADGSVAVVRSVWFIEGGERTPRFVTAYPLKQKRKT